MIFGYFTKIVDFYNLLMYAIDIATFFPGFKLINTKEYFIVKIIQLIRR